MSNEAAGAPEEGAAHASKAEEPAEELTFSAENEAEITKLLAQYPTKQAVLIPALYLAQEQYGYLSVAVMEMVAKRLDLAPSKVLNTATFYTMFKRHPGGKIHINVCTSPPCWLMGSDHVVKFFEERLGIKVGQTTSDKRFTLGRAECLASCGTAPMLECNGRYHENLTPDVLEKLMDDWTTY